MATNGSAYIIVGGSATAGNNWLMLSNAYVAAKAATPHGSALGAGNRYTIFLLPGLYDFSGSSLEMNTNYVDIIGLSPDTGPYVYEASHATYGDTVLKSTATALNLNITAGDHNITLANFCLLNAEAAPGSVRSLNTSQAGFGANLKVINILFEFIQICYMYLIRHSNISLPNKIIPDVL